MAEANDPEREDENDETAQRDLKECEVLRFDTQTQEREERDLDRLHTVVSHEETSVRVTARRTRG